MNRLFAFGCSFTHWHWPTWADILGREYDHFENWGHGGGGNLFIFNQLNECMIKNKLDSNDTVAIMWTNVYRDDYYCNNAWQLKGNIFRQKHLARYDEKGFLLRDLAFINAAKIMLEKMGIKYVFLSMVPLHNIDQFETYRGDAKILDVIDFYHDAVSAVRPSIFETVFDYDWKSRNFVPVDVDPKTCKINRLDIHASPIEHLEYLDKVAPDLVLSAKTRQWVVQVHAEVVQPSRGRNWLGSDYRPWATPWKSELWTWKEVVRL